MQQDSISLWQKIILLFSKIRPILKRHLYRFHGGIFPNHYKSLTASHPLHEVIIPDELVLPLQQHMGIHTQPLVKIGEKVLKNQLLADAPGDLSTPIHAPTSGTIIAIENRVIPHISGLQSDCIILQPDHLDSAIENSLDVNGQWPDSPDALKEIVHRAGIVGMGGAGFPTFVKLASTKGQIETLLINGAECEPFISCDDVLMQTEAEAIIKGAQIVASALGIHKIICGIESNKPKAIETMRRTALNLAKPGIQIKIKSVPTVYPMGGQKQLSYELTGIETPAQSHGFEVGLLMMNVATFASIYKAVQFGEPLTRRIVTVSGFGLQSPSNFYALIGTPFHTLISATKPSSPVNYPLMMGGPMMGFKVSSNNVPIIKTTNCILANPPEPPTQSIMPCIRCGECAEACPINLLPQQMYWHSRAQEYDKVEKLNVFDCIECGCCRFVCPSHIPLVQYYRHAKSEIKLLKKETQITQLAKKRHEAKVQRTERLAREKAARLQAKKDAVKKQAQEKAVAQSNQQAEGAQSDVPKLSARERAIAAANARKAALQQQTQQTENTAQAANDASTHDAEEKRKAAMAAAKARAAQKKQALTGTATETETITTITKTANEVAKATDTAQAPNVANTHDAEEKRKAAMAAAKARAAQKKQALTGTATETETITKTANESTAELTKQANTNTANEATNTTDTTQAPNDAAAKRQAAMAAAKARAAQKKQAQQMQNAPTPPTQSEDA